MSLPRSCRNQRTLLPAWSRICDGAGRVGSRTPPRMAGWNAPPRPAAQEQPEPRRGQPTHSGETPRLPPATRRKTQDRNDFLAPWLVFSRLACSGQALQLTAEAQRKRLPAVRRAGQRTTTAVCASDIIVLRKALGMSDGGGHDSELTCDTKADMDTHRACSAPCFNFG